MTKWTINESIKSQLNVSINNTNPKKDTIQIKLYSYKGLDELDLPDKWKGWVLDQTSSKSTDLGRLYITATYKRKEDDGNVDVRLGDRFDMVTDTVESGDVGRHEEVDGTTAS